MHCTIKMHCFYHNRLYDWIPLIFYTLLKISSHNIIMLMRALLKQHVSIWANQWGRIFMQRPQYEIIQTSASIYPILMEIHCRHRSYMILCNGTIVLHTYSSPWVKPSLLHRCESRVVVGHLFYQRPGLLDPLYRLLQLLTWAKAIN